MIVVKELGTGGQGTVLLVQDQTSGSQIAAKVFHPRTGKINNYTYY